MASDIGLDEFDFDATGISEDEYYRMLDTLADTEAVVAVKHSLPLNEIQLYVEPTSTWSIGRDIPDDITIQNAEYETHNEYGACVRVTLTTTKYLSDEEEREKYYGQEYSDEAMAFLKTQVDLFSEVEQSRLVRARDTGQLHLLVQPADTLTTTFVFNEVLTALGGTFASVSLVDGSLRWLAIAFDGSRPFSREAADALRLSKVRTYQSAAVDSVTPVGAPCEHDVETQVMLFDASVSVDDAVAVTVDGVECYQLDIEDADAAFFSAPGATDSMDGESGGRRLGISTRGYLCTLCDTAYVPRDEADLRDHYSTPLLSKSVSVSVPDTDQLYTFFVLDRAYYPLGELS